MFWKKTKRFNQMAVPALIVAVMLFSTMMSVTAGGIEAGNISHRGTPGINDSYPLQKVTFEEAVARAVNNVERMEDGYRVKGLQHTATMTSQGFQFSPDATALSWAWQLTYVGSAGGTTSDGVELGAVTPVQTASGTIAYRRGGLVEQYIARAQTIEQQFIIPGLLTKGIEDLVIAGAIQSEGAFEARANGWTWRSENGAVRLGHVTVLDASGKQLPAQMQVTAEGTQIVVDGQALAQAQYPVTVDPEVGVDDFAISETVCTPDGVWCRSYNVDVAYNSTDDEYLVVWEGAIAYNSTDDDYEFEILGQRIDAATGNEVGTDDFQISFTTPYPSTAYEASDPAVAYNSTDNEYLVVWVSNDGTLMTNREKEIAGQRVNTTGGLEGDNFRISNMGPNGDTHYTAQTPAVAYNSTDGAYLVVWSGNNYYYFDSGEFESYTEYDIWGQRVDADGSELGSDFRISDMGPSEGEGTPTEINSYRGNMPELAYSSTENEYLVVWQGDDNTSPLVDGEDEIFGQLIAGATGAETGTNDFRISDMGPNGNANYDASWPTVAYNGDDNEYFVVWHGDDDTGSLVDNEKEVYGQRINAATGAEAGTNDLRITHVGTDGSTSEFAERAHVAYGDGAYLVVVAREDHQIWGQMVSSDETLVGDITSLSDNTGTGAYEPRVAYSSTSQEYLVVWRGTDTGDVGNEIYGQRFEAPSSGECTATGSGNWTVVFAACNPGDKHIIPDGVSVTLDDNVDLDGDLELQGSGALDATSQHKTLTLTGDTPQTLTGNPLTFYRLTINKTNSTDEVTISGKLQVTSKLRVTKGKLISASDYEDIDIEATGELQLTGDITVSGNFTNTGTLTTDGWGITFNGGVSQDLVLNVATWFDDLTVDSGTTLIEVVTDDNAIVQGSLSNNGVIRKTQPVSTPDFYYFGLAGLYPDPSAYGMEIEVTDLTGGDPLTSIQVDYVAGDHTGRTGSSGNGVGWDHYWSITPTGSDFVANVTLPHDVSTPADAKACRYTGSGSVWDCKQDDVDTDYVTFSDTTEFSDWAVGEQVGPTAIKLQSLAAHNFTFSTGLLVSIGLLLAVFVAWLHRKRNRITG